jgi:hypothetical protein
MPYYQPNTITEEMLKQIVADENNAKLKTLTDKLKKMYADTDDDYDEDNEYPEFEKLREDIEFLKAELSKNQPNWHDMEEDPKLQKKWMMKVINAGLFKPNHGDGFHWLGDGYRNQNLWFWDDKKKHIIAPYTELDDYGSVPPRFLVGNGEDQFAPNNWENIVDHNNIVFLAPELVEEIKKTAKSVMTKCKYDDKERKIWHTSIMIKNYAYVVEIHLEDIADINNVFECHGNKIVKEY